MQFGFLILSQTWPNFLTAVILLCFTLSGLSSIRVFASEQEQACINTKTKIEDKLTCIDGLAFYEVTSEPHGKWRQFELTYKQPIDHQSPEFGYFQQRLALIHRAESEPMVLQTSGYSIFSVAQSLITRIYATNQLQIEHRFYGDSMPPGRDWTKLNIRQAADDFHRITIAFQQIYPKRWINTGRSKGGMTSLFHRRFYPTDVAGTLVDVAPISFNPSDQRYIRFIDQIGGTDYEYCRARLEVWQRRLLENHRDLIPLINGNFSFLGSADIAFEHAVIEAPFVFWQYHNPDDSVRGCTAIPTHGEAKQSFDFLQMVNPISQYEDQTISDFIPYYYQAATQLGSPALSTAHLERLRRFDYTLNQYIPRNISFGFNNEAMVDVDQWVSQSSHSLILVYGAFDPWSAGSLELNRNGLDNHKFTIAKKNHSAQFTDLPPLERQQVVDILSRWLEKEPIRSPSQWDLNDLTTLEVIEQNRFRPALK